jgi:hypothetical protein
LTTASQPSGTPAMPHFLHRPAVVTLSVTSAAAAASAAITYVTLFLAGHDAGYLPAALAGAIPAVAVPFAVFPRAKANWRLRRVQPGTS